jgi:glycosyltransferase involved in cell wall biosynthesis
MHYPKISIVTPSFNQGVFLEETICSVLDQKYPNLEYIIIDGGSTDNSVETIKKYEKHLTYWVSEPDRGHGHALNKGFALATGEIMAWLNSDDKYLPWTFETVAEVFNAFPEVEWIQGNPATWDIKGRMVTSSTSQKNLTDFLIGKYAWIQQESTFWRHSLWARTGGYIDDSYQFMVDGELWSRFFLTAECYRVNRVIGGFRAHTHNRSKIHELACRAEMEKLSSWLKNKVDHSVLSASDYRLNSWLYSLSKKGRLHRLFVKTVEKTLLNTYFKRNGCYLSIDWEDNQIGILKKPFTVL